MFNTFMKAIHTLLNVSFFMTLHKSLSAFKNHFIETVLMARVFIIQSILLR